MRRLMFWALFSATLMVYGTMILWSLPTISAAAGGLVPFDMRPSGYDYAEALMLFFAIVAMQPQRIGGWRYVLAAPVLGVAGFDYLENHAVAAMIDAGADGLTSALASSASLFTVLKSGFTTAAMVAVLALLLGRAAAAIARRVRRRAVSAAA
jgi:hypothetical protein